MKTRQIRVNKRILLITKSEIQIFDYIRCVAREYVKKGKKINQIELIRLYIAIFKNKRLLQPQKEQFGMKILSFISTYCASFSIDVDVKQKLNKKKTYHIKQTNKLKKMCKKQYLCILHIYTKLLNFIV